MTVVSMCHISFGRVVRTPTFGFARMHAEPRTSPSVRPHEAVPRRGRGADGAEPLREDRKRPRRHVTVGRRGHHVFDRVDLAARQSVR